MTPPSPSPETESTVQADPAVSERRRRLLKAALRSAPLVLTLPSGAALANTSAYQCIASSRARSMDTQSTTPRAITAGTPDKWERVAVPKYRYTLRWTLTQSGDNPPPPTLIDRTRDRFAVPHSLTAAALPSADTNAWVLGADQQLTAVSAYTYNASADGTSGAAPTAGANETISGPVVVDLTLVPGQEAYALAFFRPATNPADTDVPLTPDTWHRRDKTDPPASLDAGAVTALDGSCFCSVNPSAASCGFR